MRQSKVTSNVTPIVLQVQVLLKRAIKGGDGPCRLKDASANSDSSCCMQPPTQLLPSNSEFSVALYGAPMPAPASALTSDVNAVLI
mmetsp:Transcript_114413/g.222134  ORF Transcript_114413/g.222134 Transcript_114413/m.222134 type:complete len:86 (+) Transcript_114413:126-383(+)